MEKIIFEDALVVEPAKVGVLDELSVGSVIDFDGTEVPAGWEEVYDENRPSFAQMSTNKTKEFQTDVIELVTVWGNNNQETGDFYCEPLNNRIVIPARSAEYIEIYGNLAGSGYATSNIQLKDENGTWIDEINVLLQFGGNKYFESSIGPKIIKIPDTSKTYYIILMVGGYREPFHLNAGFSTEATFIGVKKIK